MIKRMEHILVLMRCKLLHMISWFCAVKMSIILLLTSLLQFYRALNAHISVLGILCLSASSEHHQTESK